MWVKALGRSVKRKTPAIKRDYSFSYKRRFRTYIHTYIHTHTRYKVDVCLRFDGRMGKVSAVTASDEQSPLPSSFIKKDKSSFAPFEWYFFRTSSLPRVQIQATLVSEERTFYKRGVNVHFHTIFIYRVGVAIFFTLKKKKERKDV